MRIGIASEWIGEQVGGLERHATSLIRGLLAVARDDEFEIFVTDRGRACLADVEGDRARVHATAHASRWYYVPFGLPLQVRRHPVDVLHATFTIAPWCPGRSVVFTVHDLCPLVYPEFFPMAVRMRLRWLLGRGIARADWIVTPSEATRQELLEHYRVPEERIVAIPHGVEPALLDGRGAPSESEEAMLRTLPDEFVLYVGRFHTRKNLARLVEAMAGLGRRRGAPLPLVIVGRDLWGEQALRRRVAELGMTSHVLFPGYVGDAALARIYSRARLFAFPTLHEGFGIPVLEAMAHGVPVVTSNVSSMPEVCGEAAVLVDPTDVEALSHAIERALGDETLRGRLVAAGKERVASFTWQRSAREHLQVYRMAAESRRAA